jgi:hypothetical protein
MKWIVHLPIAMTSTKKGYRPLPELIARPARDRRRSGGWFSLTKTIGEVLENASALMLANTHLSANSVPKKIPNLFAVANAR